MNLPVWVLFVVDILGGVLLLVFAALALMQARELVSTNEAQVVFTYLLWFSILVGIFAVSRAFGNLFPYLLAWLGYPSAWQVIAPYSGGINTLIFAALGVLTLFYGKVVDTNDTLLQEVNARKQAVEALREHRTNLEQLVEDRTASLREERERYESLFNSIQDAIVVADTDRRINNCNPAFTELFGYELAEIRGESMQILYDSPETLETMGASIADQEDTLSFDRTLIYQKRSGQIFPGDTTVFNLRNPAGENEGFIAVIRDVSDRQSRMQQLKVIDRVLQHKFHNDMNVIDGNAELIQARGGASVAEYAETIRETGADLLSTVDKEREITNFLSDPPRMESVALRSVIDRTLESVRSDYPEVSIDLDCPEDTQVRANLAIGKALEELVRNSIVHGDTEDPGVWMSVTETEGMATIKVIDRGPRIPKMEQDVLLGEEELSPLYHGSGLGLWLVKHIVNQSDGILNFEENEPRGNIVEIRLPAV